MRRRDIAGGLVATTVGSALLAGSAKAQACSAPCYTQTPAELATGVVPVNTSYPAGDVRRYGTGTGAVQKAHDQGKHAQGARPYLPAGTWQINAPIDPCKLGMYGDGSKSSRLRCNGCHAFQIPSNAGWDRPAAVFEKFAIDSVPNTCDSKFAFHFPGVATGAAVVYNVGITVRDVEIGNNGRMGGGIYLKDVFRGNFENIGMTNVSAMIVVAGSVVQCKFRNITSNNDNAGTALPRYGIWTDTATYAGNVVGVCENVVFTDCAYIRGERGIEHRAGSHVEFINFDTETTAYGAFINAECYMHGGIIAPAPSAGSWTGIFRGVNMPASYDGTIFDCIDVITLNTPAQPAQSYGFDLGDGISPVHGVIIRGCRIRGNPSSFADGIRGQQVRDATIADNFFETSCFGGTPVNIHARRLFLNRNRVPGGTILVEDGGDTQSCGELLYNQCAALLTTLSVPSRWTIANF